MTLPGKIDITKWTSISTACHADEVYLPTTMLEACRLYDKIAYGGRKPLLIGNGTNTVFCTDIIRRPVISLNRIPSKIEAKGRKTLEVGAATSMPVIAKTALKMGLSGAEFLVGVPGLVGAGLVTNAGQGIRGIWLNEIVTEVQFYHEGKLTWVASSDLNFGYRSSKLIEGAVVTAVKLRLVDGDRVAIKQTLLDIVRKKSSSQPVRKNTFGSTFYTESDGPAAIYLERWGLKGHRVGSACFSPKHSNFIECEFGGDWRDVVALIELAEAKGREEGVVFKREVRMVTT